MKRVTVIAGLLGLGLTVWMLMQFGARSILSLIMTGGWGILAATLFHTVQVALSAQAWRTIAGNTLAPALSWRDYFLLRCVREGINNLLPVAQGGGRGLVQPPAGAARFRDQKRRRRDNLRSYARTA
ncbi:hypothetical protein DmAi_08950 [Acetobacter persici]|uniref:Uncharacterized protein n=1 Tax=Acetobacter persici TaxID=1076596 RepID=A0A6V8I8A2_9PROT|nr:hypothetical protein DmAi_08950 [Acetobacter persici]